VSARHHSWAVPPEAAGERLDRHAAAVLDLPRNQVQHLIRDGHLRLGGKPAKPSAELAAGDAIAVDIPAPADDRIVPEPWAVPVLYEDDDLVVLDKPAGLTVHPGAGRATGTLAHQLLARYPEMAGVGGPGRPGIVHRLDQGTSGALVAARTAAAYAKLARAFAAREVKKHYLAVVYGTPKPAAGRIEAPIGRHPDRRREMAVRAGGRPAVTGYRTLASAGGLSLVEFDLGTGRTHQIRVHAKHLGNPLVGDPLYGEARYKNLPRAAQKPLADFPRPALHAWRLAFAHPRDGRPVAFEAPVPADLLALWKAVGGGSWPAVR
jgi:23S rRNA pseudouridine1911/1915/1917 synthase